MGTFLFEVELSCQHRKILTGPESIRSYESHVKAAGFAEALQKMLDKYPVPEEYVVMSASVEFIDDEVIE